jgi:hypothetical protein
MVHFFRSILVLTLTLNVVFFGYGQTTVTLSSTGDSHIYSGSTGSNYGTALTSYTYVASSGNFYRYLANFDLSSIPSGATIYSAKLRLTPTTVGEGGATSTNFLLQGITGTWTETGVTYANQPATTSANQVSTSSLVSSKREFDVTNIIQAVKNGVQTFNGFEIRRDSETTVTSACQYHSKDATTSTNRPSLEIVWYYPMSVNTVSITHASSSSSSDGSISPTFSGGSGFPRTYQWYNLSTSSSSAISGQTSASLSGVAPGCYGISVTGPWGDVYYMAFIVGAVCEPVHLSFYPGPDYMDDAFIFNLPTTTAVNYGGYSVEQTATWTQSGIWYESRSLMRFRLWFDPALTALSANLNLTGSNHSQTGRTNDAQLALITADWKEMVVTYTSQPSFSTSILTDVPPTTSATMDGSYDISNFWNSWKTSNPTNYGVLLKLDSYATQYTRQQYYSSDVATVSQRPYINFFVDQPSCNRTSYASFKRVQDAGYATTFQGKLKVQFTEEYQQPSGKKYPMKLYNSNKVLVAAINYDGSAVAGVALLPAVNYVFGDNRAELNLSTYSLTQNEMYILELTKSTGEKEYIEFIYTN